MRAQLRKAIPAILALFTLNAPAITRYVDLNSPSPTPPYTNWPTAATNIQSAIDASADGDEVVVTNGVYAKGGRAMYGTMTNRVAIDKPLLVRSVNGPTVTIIAGQPSPGIIQATNGNGAIRCVYVGTNAVLSGFTLTNGYTRTTGDSYKEESGGGVWCEASGLVTNCILTRNSAGIQGGGAFNGTLNNCILTKNWASSFGGGVSQGTLNGCYLISNSISTFDGGGASWSTLNNCILTGNSARWSGGGAYSSTLNNCTVSTNSAGLTGAGASDCNLNNCTLIGNSSGNQGGGAYYSSLTNCTLTGNSASNSGGGVFYGTLSNCNLTANSAALQGGGAFGGTLNNCTLNRNSALFSCGTCYCGSGGLGYCFGDGGGACYSTLNNCTLTDNFSGKRGGGAYGGTLNNCTLTGNSSDDQGGGAYVGTLNNCIVYYNTAPQGSNSFDSIFNYSCTKPLPSGPGNIDDDPLLASTIHLSVQSPCLGRGSPDYASGVDIDGEVWLNPPCIGADQFVAGAVTGALTVAISAVYTNVATGFEVSFVARITGHSSAIVWDFGDGVVVSNRPYASHAWVSPGFYEVRLTGYNDSYPSGVSASVYLRVAAQEVCYVNVANANPIFPYTNWAGAATNIQEAVDAGGQIGRLVRVTNGVYATGGRAMYGDLTNRVVVLEWVEVRSENGPSVTFIAGQPVPGTTNNGYGAIRCVYVGTNAVLSGFTLTNGHTWTVGEYSKAQSGGGVWCEKSGMVTNCTLTDNSARRGGGGAFNGTLKNCKLTRNSTIDFGGGAHQSTLINCTLTDNSAFNGGGAYFSEMNNCALIGNSAQYGGGASSCTLNNCTLTGNAASSSGGGSYSGGLNNCIVYYNLSPNGANFLSGNLNYSCTTPQPTNGIGNFTNAPLFTDLAGADSRLQSNSPCINAGDNSYVGITNDLDGELRIVGGTVDVGAYEFQSPSSLLSYVWAQQNGVTTDGSADFSDPDTDRINNWQESKADTNPTNALSALRMVTATNAASGLNVTWQSVSTRNYWLERATNFGDVPPFQSIATNIAGASGTKTYTDTSATNSGPYFYRVGVQ